MSEMKFSGFRLRSRIWVGRSVIRSVRTNSCRRVTFSRFTFCRAMVAFELVKERGGHEPDPDAIKPVLAAGLEAGLILLSCGYYGNTIRLLAPLTLPEAHLAEGLDKLEQALRV